ncbi:hypothetical protein [Streptomyces sp. NPDC047974]|uniref:hypothetical protein n=1 Tax=Streptomyces sp. NPDC047974 TaxID=3154343 RepID=UPI0033ECAF0D
MSIVLVLALLVVLEMAKPYLRAWVLDPCRATVRRWGDSIADRITEPMARLLPLVVDDLPIGRNLAARCVERWARTFPVAGSFQIAVLLGLAGVMWNGVAIRAAKSFAGAVVDFAQWLWQGVAQMPDTVARVQEHPWEGVGLLRVPLAIFFVWLALGVVRQAVVAFVGWNPLGERQEQRRARAGEGVRYGAVVMLMLCATHCARTFQEHQERTAEGRDLIGFPRVSVRRVEGVIRSAWLTARESGTRPRRHQRRELRRHAGRVVAVLRAAEARQDRDAPEALRAMATMLVKIAERYAEGRVGELLTEEELAGVEPVADRSWLHLVGSGVTVVGVLFLVSWAGVPDLVGGPVLALVVTVVVTLVYRGRIPGPADLIDIMRGADRR